MAQEYRTEEDKCCRYLSTSLYRDTGSSKFEAGAFGIYIEKRLGITCIPYGISMADLITERALIPDLFIKLPKKFFIQEWKDFPYTDIELTSPARWIFAYKRDMENVEDILHPYDDKLKEEFVERFSSDVPSNIDIYEHPNGQHFRTYEAYFRYWKTYVFAEVLSKCENIEQFLNGILYYNGRQYVLSSFRHVSHHWDLHYKETFDRISYFRTINGAFCDEKFSKNLYESNKDPSVEAAQFLSDKIGCTYSTLKGDMSKLLKLYSNWKRQADDGKRYYAQALEYLKQDVYSLLKWLEGTTKKPQTVFFEKDEWNREEGLCARLKDVVAYEEFQIEETFCRHIKSYTDMIASIGIEIDPKDAFNKLKFLNGSQSWLCSFFDLHEEISRTSIKKPLDFRMSRVTKNLIDFALRIELLIREILNNHNVCIGGNGSCKDMFEGLAKKISDPHKRILKGAVCLNAKASFRKEEDKHPSELFKRVDCAIDNDCAIDKLSLCLKEKEIVRLLLRGVAARNYFAHHNWLDNEMNFVRNKNAVDCFCACLNTVLYVLCISEEL